MANDNLRVRIAKKAYVFDVRKKFSYSQYFAPKKKEKLGILGIKKMISEAGAKKSGEKKEAPMAQAPASVAKNILKVAAIVVFILAVLLAGAWFYLNMVPSGGGGAGAESAVPYFDISATQPEVLNLGDEGAMQYAIRNVVDYRTANVSGINLTIGAYSDRLPEHVFVLDYPRDSADNFGEFRAALEDRLGKYGMAVSDIDMEELATIPAGAAVVIPTGYVPSPLLGGQDGIPYVDIVERGVTLIYIGQPWNEGAIAPNRDIQTVQSADPYGLVFSKSQPPVSTDGFSLFNGLYTVEGRGQRVLANGMVYGSVSYVKMGQGYILFLPQSLDGGWRKNGTLAGEDVARLVFGMPWLKPLLANTTQIALRENETGGSREIFTMPLPAIDPIYLRLFANLTDLSGGWSGQSTFQTAKKTMNSDIFMSAPGNVVAPTSITGDTVSMMLVLREGTSARAKLLLQTIFDGAVNRSEEIENGLTALDSRKSYYYDASLPDGDYVLRLVDTNDTAYAQAIMRVKEIGVNVMGQDWKGGNFLFQLIGPTGDPVLGKDVSVSIDGKQEQEFRNADIISYNVTPPEAGKTHIFRFRVGGAVKTLPLAAPQVRKQFWENPLVLAFGFLSLMIAGAGMYFAKPERALFGLDIPDFPPMSQIKIPVSRTTVLEIFEQVNKDYSWQRMPLRLKEIKDGFRKLTYNGKPILVGDYNLERLLERLEREGHVKSSRGFYGLARWEKESGKSMFQMSMYRQMRDIFVTNAVRFTKLGASNEYDVLVDIRKGGVYVQIYENEGAVARAIATAKAGPTIIVFADEDRLEEFMDMLVSTNESVVALKVYLDNGVVTATSIDKLEKLVKDLRGG